MAFDDVWKTVVGVLTALGGGAAIVIGAANWLGKVWAERLMVQERSIKQWVEVSEGDSLTASALAAVAVIVVLLILLGRSLEKNVHLG